MHLESLEQVGHGSALHQNRKESAGLKPLPSTSVEDVEPSADKTTSFETTQPAKKKSKSKSKNKASEPSLQDIAYCPLCDINCTGSETYVLHCAGKQHCKKYLVKQNEIGFDDFRLRYGKLAYNKDDSDEPPPEVEDDYVIHAYRSGVYNKLNCRACCCKVFTYSAWYNHILSQEHGEQMIELLSRHGGSAFMSQFGDLPGPNPNLFHIEDDGLLHKKPVDSAQSEPHLHFRGANEMSAVHDWQRLRPLSDVDRGQTDWFTPLRAPRFQNPGVHLATSGYQYHSGGTDVDADYSCQRDLSVLRAGHLTARNKPVDDAHDTVSGDPASSWHQKTMDFLAACNRPAGLHAVRRRPRDRSYSPEDRWPSDEASAAARRDRYDPAETQSFSAAGPRRDMKLKCFDHGSESMTAARRPRSRSPVFAGHRQDNSRSDQRRVDSLFSDIIQSAGLTQYYQKQQQRPPSERTDTEYPPPWTYHCTPR